LWGGGDQLPPGLAGSEPTTEEAVGAPDVLGLCEDRFDYLLASAVEQLRFGGREHRLDPPRVIALAG
jgi:hypothetical protein